MGCTSCLEQSLRDTQRALTKERCHNTMLRTVLTELRPTLQPEQQKKVDAALNGRFM